MIVVVAWLAFILGGEAAAFTRVLDTIVGAVIAAVVFFLIPTWNVDRISSLFKQWCSYAGVALTTTLAQDDLAEQTVAGALSPIGISTTRNIGLSLLPREPRAGESPWPLANLPLITEAMEASTLDLVRLRRFAHDPSRQQHEKQAVEYAEWLDSIGAGRSRQALAGCETTSAELKPLAHSLTRLASLTTD